MRSAVVVRALGGVVVLGVALAAGCDGLGGNTNVNGTDTTPGQLDDWRPPRKAAEWLSKPVRGAVVEIGYGGPDEFNDPPYPSVASLRQLRGLGARVVAVEFQFAWTIEPPYEADENQFVRLTAALDNVAEAGLYTVLCVRNGPRAKRDDAGYLGPGCNHCALRRSGRPAGV